MFSVRVFDRDGNHVPLPTQVEILPKRWESEVVGGPKTAEFELKGLPENITALASWLGYQIRIMSDATVVWWGQIDTLSFSAQGISREVKLRGMANRVKVLYSTRLPGGSQSANEEDWIEDLESVSRYGRREYVHSAPGTLSQAQAQALQQRLLEVLSKPQRGISVDKSAGTGRMAASGYWSRLGEVYYAQEAGLEEYIGRNDFSVPVGLVVSSAYIGFGGASSAKLIHQVFSRFMLLAEYAGLKIQVAGTASNDGHYTIVSGTRQEAWSTTSDLIWFEYQDDIRDGDFATLEVNDMIWVSGSSIGGNNGAKLVKTTGVSNIEVSPGWSGGSFVTSYAGPTITILRGNSLSVGESVTIERPDGTTTEHIYAYGQVVYQTFELAVDVDWTVARIDIRAMTVGSPSDSLRINIVLDSAGSPGAVLESATVLAADIADVMDWVTFEFSNTTTLEYGTVYGIYIDRTGAVDDEDVFDVSIDPNGDYTRGSLYLHDGTTFQTWDGTLHFRVMGAQDNSLQIQEVIGNSVTEITSVVVSDLTGIETLQYQSGDETSEAIVASLLDQGDSAGNRMLAEVMYDLKARIFAQPAAERLFIWRDGRICNVTGVKEPEGWLPVGVWVYMDDVLLTGAWDSFSPVFVERASFQVGQGLTVAAEYQSTLASLVRGVQQG